MRIPACLRNMVACVIALAIACFIAAAVLYYRDSVVTAKLAFGYGLLFLGLDLLYVVLTNAKIKEAESIDIQISKEHRIV